MQNEGKKEGIIPHYEPNHTLFGGFTSLATHYADGGGPNNCSTFYNKKVIRNAEKTLPFLPIKM